MKKMFLSAVVAIAFCACSEVNNGVSSNVTADDQNGTVSAVENEGDASIKDVAPEVAEDEQVEVDFLDSAPIAVESKIQFAQENFSKLPYFVFGENGERFQVVDEVSGSTTPITMKRKTLVVADENEFEDVQESALMEVLNNEELAVNLSRPADYICDDGLLALNEMYEAVTTQSGKVLLDDQKLLESCEVIPGAEGLVLKKDLYFNRYTSDVTAAFGAYYVHAHSKISRNKAVSYAYLYKYKKVGSVNKWVVSPADSISIYAASGYRCTDNTCDNDSFVKESKTQVHFAMVKGSVAYNTAKPEYSGTTALIVASAGGLNFNVKTSVNFDKSQADYLLNKYNVKF